VDGVSLSVPRGKTLGLVGESGSGKTTLGRTIIGLIKPTSGKVAYDGADMSLFDNKQMKNFRRRVQMVFQDPFGSLNPRMKILSTVSEGFVVHGITSGRGIRQRSERLMEMVGLEPAHLDRYPHEFSGGQRQRIGIARAIAVEPEFLICDEPVSSLDVTIQVQIINLLLGLQAKFGFGCLFISHDLRVIRHVSDEIAVMYQGKIVEQAPTEEIFNNPRLEYTKLLLLSIPNIDDLKYGVRS
jgi:ABC-type oligopeptide transport system ATPase subunit